MNDLERDNEKFERNFMILGALVHGLPKMGFVMRDFLTKEGVKTITDVVSFYDEKKEREELNVSVTLQKESLKRFVSNMLKETECLMNALKKDIDNSTDVR